MNTSGVISSKLNFYSLELGYKNMSSRTVTIPLKGNALLMTTLYKEKKM